MRLAILSSMLLSVLALATGCAASGQGGGRGTTPGSLTDDPSWNPPDDMNLAIKDGKSAQPKTDVVATMPTPNKRQIVTGQLRTTN